MIGHPSRLLLSSGGLDLLNEAALWQLCVCELSN